MNSIQYSLNDKNIKTSRPGVFIFKLKEVNAGGPLCQSPNRYPTLTEKT